MKHGKIVAAMAVVGLLAAGSVLLAGEGGGRGKAKGGFAFGGGRGGGGKADLGGQAGAGALQGGAAGGEARGGGALRERMKQRFAEMDADHDGQVTFEEFKTFRDLHMRDAFEQLDRNGDGVLNRADRPAGRGPGEGGAGAGGAAPAAKLGVDGV